MLGGISSPNRGAPSYCLYPLFRPYVLQAGGALGFGKSLDDKKDGKDGAIPGSKPKKIGF